MPEEPRGDSPQLMSCIFNFVPANLPISKSSTNNSRREPMSTDSDANKLGALTSPTTIAESKTNFDLAYTISFDKVLEY